MAQNKSSSKSKRLVLLDAHAILHRAYHALPEFSSPKGEPTGALYGLSAMLIKIINDLEPDYIVACYDLPGPTFRHEAYEAYKAKRPKAEEDLIHQMKRSRDIFEAFHIPVYEKAGFEADDIIGTIVEMMNKEIAKGTIEILIASGDMDTLQLVEGNKVQVYTLKKGINETILYDEKAVKKRFGFSPELLPDYKGLKGDPSDNIVGISGIGDKTAVLLIQEFGTIENIYKILKKNPSLFLKKGVKERIVGLLKEGEEEALFSKTLASIRKDAPISFSLPKHTWKNEFSAENMKALFAELGFRTLYERAKKIFGEGGGTTNTESHEKNNDVEDPEEIKKIGIALWLINSNITNPKLSDILSFARTSSFPKAREVILSTLKKFHGEKVYKEIELPLISIFREAEKRGILIDTGYLKELSKNYHKKLEKLQHSIWEESGVQFNINSPQQLGEIIFDRLGIPTKGLRKTEGGARSTRESELEKLKGRHPIIEHILLYRELQKLLSTYIDNIPKMIGADGRLHTTFIQTGTTTGRISSINPNLQNIPNRGEYGRKIRKAFCSEKGYVFGAFDYSQIDLRMLAILSQDKDFINIFKEGKDIHNSVAAEVFNVFEDDVTRDMRRKAKVINFGILYGMGVTSLQKSLESTREDAQRFYDGYFKEFPGVAHYIQKIKQDALRLGYTETLFGRRRYIEGIRSHIPYIRAGAERMAVNAPIQGSAADIIKLAMDKVHKVLQNANLIGDVHLLLQVHDELVYEIKERVLNDAVSIIKKEMENVYKAEIPIEVSVKTGKNWGEM